MSIEVKNFFINKLNENKKHLLDSNRKEKTGSIIELLTPFSPQSFSIKLGNVFENSFRDYIENKGFILEKSYIDKEGNYRQADLMISVLDKKYYFEIKNNVNLDTEKVKAVVSKLEERQENGYIVGVLSFREADKVSLKKYTRIPSKYLFGYNDFFRLFNDELTYDEFKEIINSTKKILMELFNEPNV